MDTMDIMVERNQKFRDQRDAAHAEIADLKRQLGEARERADRWSEWRDKAESYERQLVCISRVLGGKDAQHVSEGFEPSIAGLVDEQLSALHDQNAKLREALSHALFLCGEGVANHPQAALYSLRFHLQSALRETSDESEVGDAND